MTLHLVCLLKCLKPIRLRAWRIAAIGTLATAGLPALAQADADTAAVWRVTSRLGYGPTQATAAAAQPDPKAWAGSQVDTAYAASQKPPTIAAELARFNQPLALTAKDYNEQREARKNIQPTAANMLAMPDNNNTNTNTNTNKAIGFGREMQQSAAAWRLMSCSDPAVENPLLARMTEFWFNHLNVFVSKGAVQPFVGHYVVNVIRANALGKFEDMLLASARHPAMLLYLDQAQSNVRGLNENYARELMELHTVGVDAGYTQNDIRELARILTGRTVRFSQGEGFTFIDRLHDKGAKTLLGRNYPADNGNVGMAEGDDAIIMLARHPATARRIANRLAATFVADKPPQALIDRLAATFSRTQGDMRAVMRTLVESPEFWRADNSLFKTPLDFACSALAAGGGIKDRRDIQLTLGFLGQAGQALHGWQTPDGYKTDAATWLVPQALTRRADFALALGSRMAEPAYLTPFLSASTRQRIAVEPAAIRAGLMLASPDFMSK